VTAAADNMVADYDFIGLELEPPATMIRNVELL